MLIVKTPLNLCIIYTILSRSVSSAKFLGVTISDDLTWTIRIDNITNSVNQILRVLKKYWAGNKDIKAAA